MTARDDTGRKFSDDVERLLRGEEPPAEGADPDYLETVQFARRLVDLGQEPDAEFARRLRGRLLTEMAGRDADARDSRSWSVRLFSRPGLRLAMVSTFVVVAAVGLLWRAGLLLPTASQPPQEAAPGMLSAPPAPIAPEAGAPTTASAAADTGNGATLARTAPSTSPLEITGYSESAAGLGEDINITIEFRNTGSDGYVLTPFPPAVTIRDVATGQIAYTSAAGTSRYSLAALQSIDYQLTWDQRDDGGAQVLPGRYQVDVEGVEAQLEKGGMSVPAGASDVTAFDILPQTADGTAGGMATTVG